MDMNQINKVEKIYEKLTYFDQYGSSFILFIIITIVLLLFTGASYAFSNIQFIKDDWANQRCKPYIMPIAGFINKPPDISIKDFTAQNFTYCIQNTSRNITGIAIEPINFATNTMTKIAGSMSDAINDIRAMTSKTRSFFQSVTEEIMGRLMNIMIPLQQIIISFKDFISKIQGTMTASLFTSLGTFYALKSLLGAIAQFIIIILITLAALIAVFWIFPFTWGAALANTAIFVALSIPMALILTFMTNVLHVNTGLSVPTLKSSKCFDKNTEFVMNNGIVKKISEIEVGEKLENNNLITSKIIVESKDSVMYNLNGVIVSNSHLVKYNDKWVAVENHPQAVKLDNYCCDGDGTGGMRGTFLYCLNTESKTIELNNMIFSDWDEIFDEEIDKIKNMKIKNVKYSFDDLYDDNIKNSDIHKYIDGGFHPNTIIRLKDGIVKKIKNINIGDILENGERVYGYVEIDGENIFEQCSYCLAKNKFVVGGTNLNICDKTINFTSTLDLDKRNKKLYKHKEAKLYHLLTNKKTFYVNEIQFYDYNSCIDLFLDKYRGKLLSMKYV
uniref:Vint domain-containing protein n=1 Tax=viral metagenome TaxID=1070528 RepID=A0A6C0DL60_9ZZZZ